MQSLDERIKYPREMVDYLNQFGFHFNKRACEYASKMMKRKNQATGKNEPIEPFSKEQVEDLLSKNNVKLENNKLYDFVFVANMAKADYWKSSIEDERHLALFVKDYIDDADGSSELAFRRWIATMIAVGEPIEWSDLI